MFLSGLFYTKNIHKLLIHKSYDDCIKTTNTFVKKYPDYKYGYGYYTYDDVKTFNEEKLIDWKKYGMKWILVEKSLQTI